MLKRGSQAMNRLSWIYIGAGISLFSLIACSGAELPGPAEKGAADALSQELDGAFWSGDVGLFLPRLDSEGSKKDSGSNPGDGGLKTGGDGGRVGGGDVVEDVCPAAGGLLCPCQDNSDCDSGWCVEGPDGNVCTQECISECPDGFVCRQMAGSDNDVIFLCVYPYTRLCRPCTADSECSANGGSLGDRCVDNGGSGQSCGVACSEDIKCPDGYLCAQVMTVAGSTTQDPRSTVNG